MKQDVREILRAAMPESELAKLEALDNDKLHRFVAEAVARCRPADLFVCTDAPEDLERIRTMALETGEEASLAVEGHTVHFDGPRDQARDKGNTKYLVRPGQDLGSRLNTVDREEGLGEINRILDGSMADKTMIVRFLCLGPTNSPFSISCVQITDSPYVAHSESLLYRAGYEQFRRIGSSPDFFRFLHSEGPLENGVSRDVANRRVYIDLEDEIVYSTNTQYAGNTVGLKKLALRLAIRKADREHWLAEHMFLMAVVGPEDRATYFTGAFPSACGKTSTAMTQGNRVVGDDLAYLRLFDGQVRAVNVESGIFGIIENVNQSDDPLIWKLLHEPGEVIFSNVLVADGRPYWLGMGVETPKKGVNFQGEWYEGKTDEQGKPVPLAHKNARYTIRLDGLANLDPTLHDPQGVALGGIIYGGRDADTWVPVCESFDWAHGVCTFGASLESKTTAATLGAQGVRTFNIMSNLDFLSLPLGRYLVNHLKFGARAEPAPRIFAVNYFLEDDRGRFLNTKLDKIVWLQWMERRVRDGIAAIETPVGWIPRYEDLARLFEAHLGKEYSREDYERQFSIRIDALLAKLDRIEAIYRKDVPDTPEELYRQFDAQRKRLEDAARNHGARVISPSAFAQEVSP